MNHVESLIQSWAEIDRWSKEEMGRIIDKVDRQCAMTSAVSNDFGDHFANGGVVPEGEECDTSPGAMSGEH